MERLVEEMADHWDRVAFRGWLACCEGDHVGASGGCHRVLEGWVVERSCQRSEELGPGNTVRASIGGVGPVRVDHDRAATDVASDESLGRELTVGADDRGPVDTEHGSQPALRWEPRARGKLTAEDAAPELVGELPVERDTCRTVEPDLHRSSLQRQLGRP